MTTTTLCRHCGQVLLWNVAAKPRDHLDVGFPGWIHIADLDGETISRNHSPRAFSSRRVAA